MKLNPRHKYLILSSIRLSGHKTLLYLNENEILTGAHILSLMKGKDFINVTGLPKPVYDITTGQVYLFCINAMVIPSAPDLTDVDGHLVPLQILMDLELSKLPKYLNHRYETVRNLARYLIANYKGEQP